MPRLLVSVNDATEAAAALAGGADLIDVKDPNHGSLGAAPPETWHRIRSVVQGVKPLSVALGDALENFDQQVLAHLHGIRFAKLGLSGCANQPDWVRRWRRIDVLLAKQVSTVAVAFADWRAAEAPSPARIIAQARALGCRALLIDTHDKTAGDVFEHLSLSDLNRLFAQARDARLQVALAGSLSMSTLDSAIELTPDWIAVRGAVCRGGRRTATVDAQLVARIARRLQRARVA